MQSTSGNEVSTYSHTENRILSELSLKQISEIFVRNWILFVLLFCIFSFLSVGFYILKVPYIGHSVITINDNQNSSLQSFATQFFGLSKTADGKKTNSPLLKHAEYLKTTEFFDLMLKDIQTRGQSSSLTIAEATGYNQFKDEYLNDLEKSEKRLKVLSVLDSMSKTKIDSDFQLKVSFSAPTKEMALFLTNTALNTTMGALKKRDLSDISKIENFIKEQKEIAEKNMYSFNKQLAEFQNKPENLISLSSKEKVGEYLSDLMVRKNEIKMKMAENQKIISYLSQGKTTSRESQLYGNGGRVETLKLENQMHQNQLANIQSSIDRVTSMAKSIPVATQVFDELKKKSDIEFQKYKNLSEAQSKAEAQKLSIESRFEVLEPAYFDKVAPLVSLSVLILISLILSQIIGSILIYIRYIWDSNTITAQSSRNVVIIDGHSLDPRVIIENSKIRFRLKDSREEDSSTNDFAESQRLTFRLFNKKSANGEEPELF